ncbi:cupin domain-containing protein [uncultured Desulfuromusa sp.]|uniref:cupin domain-containing protein n=1 Tax=uncultured Desulfuromusa sp. TaxID=219183 RepID=UPI002AA78F5A|nr:cupin domain-containing protein [uncultured Desulfuromusa sp.]
MSPQVVDNDLLRKIIGEVVSELDQNQNDHLDKTIDQQSGVISVRAGKVKPKPFATGKEGDKVYLSDLFSLEESPRLGSGIMEMRESSFDWMLKYDEIDYVIEGKLEVVIDGRKIVGEAGDVIFIPKDTAIQFSVSGFARFLYVTYPADWENQ